MKEGLACCKRAYQNTGILPLEFPEVKEEEKQKMKKCMYSLLHEDMETAVSRFLQNDTIFDLSWMKDEEKKQFYELSSQFVKDAKAFDDTLSQENIFQALRNIWIIWMLELLFHKPMQYHKAMFGYSMLYPYSDNLLDDTSITHEDKKAFNQWFTSRLHGEKVICDTDHLKKIDMLVGCIETVFDREIYPDVYESLYLIQQAQINSLQQHLTSTKQDILTISIEKGGTSVIADGYLIDGNLTKEQFQFCIDFGFGLQISDDLQDELEDESEGHHTLATMCRDKTARWELFRHCWYFLKNTMDRFSCHQPIRDFVCNSCLQLLATCVLQNEDRYPARYHHQMKALMPVEQEELEQINATMKAKMEEFLV